MGASVRDASRCNSTFSLRKARQFAGFLSALSEGREYAIDLQSSPAEFALNISDARSFDVQLNDLKWMLGRRWITLVDDHRECGEQGEVSEHIMPTILPSSRFVILRGGCDVLHQSKTEVHSEPSAAVDLHCSSRPRWDSLRHELSIDGRIVKRFRWPASNQEAILMAFEEDDWPSRIDDPLPGSRDLEPKRRLSDTIKCLNRNQCERLLRFRGDGTGEGVLWDRYVDSRQGGGTIGF